MAEETHPHQFMADFINKYEKQIRPRFEEKDVEAGNVGVLDVDMGYKNVWEVPAMMVKCKNGTYERYCSAVQKLAGLPKVLNEITEDHEQKKLIQHTLLEINKDVAELKFILRGDEIYEKFRKREDN